MMQDTLDRSKHLCNLLSNAMCFSLNAQCKSLSFIHAAKYMVIAQHSELNALYLYIINSGKMVCMLCPSN